MSRSSYLRTLWAALSGQAAPAPAAPPAAVSPAVPAPSFAIPFPPEALDAPGRIALTASCRDADSLPRAPGAGQISQDPATGQDIQIMHCGVKVLAGGYYGEWMADLIARLDGVHEPQEELVFSSLLPLIAKDAVMIEVGAFWSYYTLWFLHDCPGQRRGIGIEMDPRHIEIGRRNAALNGLDITLVQGRIGAEDAAPAEFDTESSGPQRMPTFGLEGLLREAEAERADLLLCDAQGGEIDLLAGMRTAVQAGRVGVLVMSTHHHAITGDPLTHQRALAMIADLGGVVRLEHDVAESFSGDGLIVADFGGQLEHWTPPAISRCRTSHSLFRDPLFDLAAAMGLAG